jgi:hypothetical protein
MQSEMRRINCSRHCGNYFFFFCFACTLFFFAPPAFIGWPQHHMEAALIPSLLTSTSRPHGMQTRAVPFLNFAIFHLLSFLLPVSQITIRFYPHHMIAASSLMNRTRKTGIVGSHQFLTKEAQLISRFSPVESDQLMQIMLYVRKIMRRVGNDIAGLVYPAECTPSHSTAAREYFRCFSPLSECEPSTFI